MILGLAFIPAFVAPITSFGYILFGKRILFFRDFIDRSVSLKVDRGFAHILLY